MVSKAMNLNGFITQLKLKDDKFVFCRKKLVNFIVFNSLVILINVSLVVHAIKVLYSFYNLTYGLSYV